MTLIIIAIIALLGAFAYLVYKRGMSAAVAGVVALVSGIYLAISDFVHSLFGG